MDVETGKTKSNIGKLSRKSSFASYYTRSRSPSISNANSLKTKRFYESHEQKLFLTDHCMEEIA